MPAPGATRRPGPSNGRSRSSSPAETVAARLSPPPSDWARDTTMLMLGVTVLVGWLLIADHPGLAAVATITGCAAAIAFARHGRLQLRRALLRDRCVEALAPLLKSPALDRGTVRVRSWPRGGVTAPARVCITYSPMAEDDAAWLAEVVRVTSRRLLGEYALLHHDRTRLTVDLGLAPAEEQQVPERTVLIRARRVAVEVLGAESAVEDDVWDRDDQLAGFTIRHDSGPKLSAAQSRARVERVVSTMLPGRWRARWDLEGDAVRFELRPVMPRVLPHPPYDPDAPRDRIPLAVSEDGETVEWSLTGTAPHAMFIGKTGTGKTVAINGAVMEMAARGYPVWIVDGKRVEFLGLRGWPNVQVVATDVRDQIALIYKAHQLMEQRYLAIENGEADESDFEPLILVLDEYRDFVANVTEYYATVKVTGMPAKCPILEKVGSLGRKARTARIHMLLGTQRPDADWLGGEVRDNFATRMSLGRLSPQGSMMMWDSYSAAVSVPSRIAGRGNAYVGDDVVAETQALWTPDPRKVARTRNPDDLAILAGLRPTQAVQPWLDIVVDEPDYDDYRDQKDDKAYLRAQWYALETAKLVQVPQPQLPRPRTVSISPASVRQLLAAPDPLNLTVHHQDPSRPRDQDTTSQQDDFSHAPSAEAAPRDSIAGGSLAPARHLRLASSNPRPTTTSAPAPPATAPGSTWSAPADEVDDDRDAAQDAPDDIDDPDGGYGPPEDVQASGLHPGDLILIAPRTWATVEAAEPDIDDEDYFCIDWRDSTDGSGALSVPASEHISTRRPLEENL